MTRVDKSKCSKLGEVLPEKWWNGFGKLKKK